MLVVLVVLMLMLVVSACVCLSGAGHMLFFAAAVTTPSLTAITHKPAPLLPQEGDAAEAQGGHG